LGTVFRKNFDITYKDHGEIQKFYAQQAESPLNVFKGMQQQSEDEAHKGKKMFLDQTNVSDKKNMYLVIDPEEGGNDLYFKRTTTEFNNKHGLEYNPPSLKKSAIDKNTFVHNCVVNKNKVNVDHFDKIYNKHSFNANKMKILRAMHEHSIDFNKLTSFKNALFDSELLKDNHLVPMSVWREEAHHF
jgi:hypothetical protein